MSIRRILRRFGPINSDYIKHEQPDNTISDAVGVAKPYATAATGYVSSEHANEMFVDIDVYPRGAYLIEEKNQVLTLGINKQTKVAEIGIIDLDKKCYKKIISESELDCSLGLNNCEWVDVQAQIFGSCREMRIYFSTGSQYRVINIEDPCRDFSDTKLMKARCVTVGVVEAVKGLGNLPSGSYQVSLKVEDGEGNDTNYSCFTQPISVGGKKCRQGEETNYALLITFSNLPEDFSLANLVVRETNGNYRDKVISDLAYGGREFKYTYTGNEGTFQEDILTFVKGRTQRVFEGSGFHIAGGRALLSNVKPAKNLNIQKYINRANVSYCRYAVRASKASEYTTLRPNENYDIGFLPIYTDGRKSEIVYPFINKNVIPGKYDTCNKPQWMTEDTSYRTGSFFSGGQSTEQNNLSIPISVSEKDGSFDVSIDSPSSDMLLKEVGCGSLSQGSGKVSINIPCGQKQYCFHISAVNQGCGYSGELNLDNLSEGVTNLNIPCTSPNIENNEASTAIQTESRASRDELQGDDDVVDVDDGIGMVDTNSGLVGNAGQADDDENNDNDDQIEIVTNALNCIQTQSDCGPIELDPEDSYTPPEPPELTSTQQTDIPCEKEGELQYISGILYRCNGGTLEIIIDEETIKKSRNANRTDNDTRLPITVSRDPETCLVKDEPIKFSEGQFGYWETENLYPKIEFCNENGEMETFFGEELDDKPNRLFRTPSRMKEPIYISASNGASTKYEVDNDICDDAWVIITGPSVSGISLPKDILDQLCGFQVVVARRAEQDKTVISTGSLITLFEGDSQGDTKLFPKNGWNSFEFYDHNVNAGGTNTLRKGRATEIPAALYHSADYHLYGNHSRPDYFLVEQEEWGDGRRLGDYVEGEQQSSWTRNKFNNFGRRNIGSLTNYKDPEGSDGNPIILNVKAIDDAKADGYVNKSDQFTASLINLCRESGQYVEFEEDIPVFTQDAFGEYGSTNGGDGRSDNSFIGDVIDQEAIIPNIRSLSGSMMRYLPNQYGSVINREYIPIGVSGDLNDLSSGGVEGFGGDSYVGCFSVKRTSCVTDKVYKNISPNADVSFFEWQKFSGVLGILNPILSPLRDTFNNISRCITNLINVQECGTVPVSGIDGDDRYKSSLRGDMRSVSSKSSPSIEPPTTGECPDGFYPHVLKMLVKTFTVSDANVSLRGIGDIIGMDEYANNYGLAELHAEKLGPFKLDAGSKGYYDSWLTRFYMKAIEASRAQLIVRNILEFIVVCALGIYIMVVAIQSVIEGLGKVGSGTFGFGTVGAVALILWGVALLVGGIKYMQYFTQGNGKSLIRRMLGNFLGIEWCYPDVDFGSSSGGCRYGMDKDRVVQFEDNYFYFNPDYNKKNVEEISLGVPARPDFRECKDYCNGVVMASGIQDTSSNIDAYRRFKVRERFVVPTDRGKITKISDINGRVFVHTTESLFAVQRPGQRLSFDGADAVLGQANLFGKPQDLFGNGVEGYGGLQDPNSSIMTSAGEIWIDERARDIFIFNGGIDTIKFEGVKEFFSCNMGLYLQERFPEYSDRDNNNGSGIGYSLGVDHTRNLLYVSKKDYEVLDNSIKHCKGKFTKGSKNISLGDPRYFRDRNITAVFSLDNGSFVSRHLFAPDMYLFNRRNLFSVKNGKLWKHGSKYRFNEFYGKKQPIYVEIPISLKDYHKSFELIKVIVIGEVIKWDSDGMSKEIEEPVFDKIQIYNGKQASNWVGLDPVSEANKNDAISRMRVDKRYSKWEFDQNCLVINKFEGYNTCPSEEINNELQILQPSKQTGATTSFVDDMIVVRLLSEKDSNKQVVFRKIILEVDIDEENVLTDPE